MDEQQRLPSGFQPIHSYLSSDSSAPSSSDEEPMDFLNKSIFRQPEDSGNESPPLVCRANPIESMEEDDDDCCDGEAITPYSLSHCQEEMDESIVLESSIPQLASLSPGSTSSNVDYSFYFEPSQSRPVPYWEDGVATKTDAFVLMRGPSPAQISDSDSMASFSS